MLWRLSIFVVGGLLFTAPASAHTDAPRPPYRAAGPQESLLQSLGNPARPGPAWGRTTTSLSPEDELWANDFGLPAIDGFVLGAVQFGDQVIMGGRFTQVGGVPAANIAAWDGTRWSAVGKGTDGDVLALAVYAGNLIAAGRFGRAGDTEARCIARWNGSEWFPLGSGLELAGFISTEVFCLLPYRNALIAGGTFTNSGQVPLRNVARWDGAAWSPLGGGTNGVVRVLAAFEDTLFAGGDFDSAGAAPAASIGKWDGSTWSEVAGGVQGGFIQYVDAMAVYNGRLIVGGGFAGAGGIPAPNLVAWDGSAWDSLGAGSGGDVLALAVHQDTLFVAGAYPQGLSKWYDHEGFSTIPLLDGNAYCLLDLGDALLIGGDFEARRADLRLAAQSLVCWSGGTWQSFETWQSTMHGLMSGIAPPNVLALAAYQSGLVASGYFRFAGDPPQWANVLRLADWDGRAWHQLPLPPGSPDVLLARDDTLYACCAFRASQSGSAPAARFDGSVWTALDALALNAHSMAFYNGDLYAGGCPQLGDAPESGGVYHWDGSHWQPIGITEGTSPSSGVYSMVEYGDKLIVGGLFTQIGGVAANNVAAWDGSHWQPLGGGFPTPPYDVPAVSSLVTYRGTLIAAPFYVGLSQSVMQWDGTVWRPLGTLTGVILCLTSIDGELFAGGSFLRPAGPIPVLDGIVHWDGKEWRFLGSGVNGYVWSLAFLGESLYLGGAFTQAGGHSSFGIARWDGLPVLKAPTYMLSSGAPNPFQGSANFAYTLPRAGRLRIAVFNSAGRQVAVLEDREQAAGPHSVTWNGRDAEGIPVPAGVYFVHARFPDGTSRTRKTVRLR